MDFVIYKKLVTVDTLFCWWCKQNTSYKILIFAFKVILASYEELNCYYQRWFIKLIFQVRLFFYSVFSVLFWYMCSEEGIEKMIFFEKIKHILQILIREHFNWALDIVRGHWVLNILIIYWNLMLMKDKISQPSPPPYTFFILSFTNINWATETPQEQDI